MLTKREQFIYDNVVYGGRTLNVIWFVEKNKTTGQFDALDARYIIGESGGVSFYRDNLATTKRTLLPKRFVDILRIIAFPEVL